MYIDEVVISGIVIVALTLVFFVGFYLAVRRDINSHKGENKGIDH